MTALGKRIRSPPRKGSIWLRKSHSAMRVWREDRRFKFDNGEIISRKKVWSKGQQKGVIVKVQTDEGYIEYVYYPRPEHMAAFEDANYLTKAAGPSEYYLGSVGSLRVSPIIMVGYQGLKNYKNYKDIRNFQAHFFATPGSSVNRSLAPKYSGWSRRILGEIFDEAKKSAFKIRYPKRYALKSYELNDKLKKSELERMKLFTELARQNGFSVEEDEFCLIASLPAQQ